jgi:GNAT superfamily N-acetyltransferase
VYNRRPWNPPSGARGAQTSRRSCGCWPTTRSGRSASASSSRCRTFIPYLAYQGGWRALIEAVRVDSRQRSRGLGKTMFEWAIARARERGCHMVQLTPDKARADAKRFYESLGFVASHVGMKLHLTPFPIKGS